MSLMAYETPLLLRSHRPPVSGVHRDFEFSHYNSAHQAQEQLATFLRGRGESVEVREEQGWFTTFCGGVLLLSTLLFTGIMVFNILEKSKKSVSVNP